MFETILYYLCLIYFIPIILIGIVSIKISKLFLIYSLNKYHHPGGLSYKIYLKTLKHGLRIFSEVPYEAFSFATQIKEKEIIMKAIRANEAYEFISKEEMKLPKKEQTIFLVKYIDPYKAARLGDQIFDVKGAGNARKERLLTGTQQLEICKECLDGWRNFESPDSTNENKKYVEFDKGDIDGMLAMIPPKVRAEIADFARGESELEEGE